MTIQYPGMMPTTGAERIAAERDRQIHHEGYNPDHDTHHEAGELVDAAKEYVAYASWVRRYPDRPLSGPEFLDIRDLHGFRAHNWPWAIEDFKPSTNYVRNLEKAGALIAAEIDRALAAQERRDG